MFACLNILLNCELLFMVRIQCNDGFDYTAVDVNVLTVYVCNETRWIPTLPVCESNTITTDSQKSSTTGHPEVDGRIIIKHDASDNVNELAESFTKITTVAIPTVKGMLIVCLYM